MREVDLHAAHALLDHAPIRDLPDSVKRLLGKRVERLASESAPRGEKPAARNRHPGRATEPTESPADRAKRWKDSTRATARARTFISKGAELPIANDILTLLLDRLGLGPVTDPASTGPSTAIALQGGGAQGAFEVGALAYLTKRLTENKIDYVCGSSTGALNALALSARGVTGGTRTLVRIYLGLMGTSGMYSLHWRFQNVDAYLRAGFGTTLQTVMSGGGPEMNPDDILFYDRWWVRATTYGAGIIGQIVAAYILWQVTDEVRNKLEYLKLITQQIERAESVYTLDPVRQLINTHIPLDSVGTIPLRMATVEMESGLTHYVDENGDFLIGAANSASRHYRGKLVLSGTKSQNLANGAIASASIPGVFPAQAIQAGHGSTTHFIDGNVRESIPLAAAKELGVQRIIGILATPLRVPNIGVGSSPTMSQTLGRAMDVLTNELAVNEHSPTNTFCDALERILIYPESFIHSPLAVDPGLLRINMAYGYMRAHDMYRGQTNQLNVGGGAILLAFLATEALVALRMEAHRIETALFHNWFPQYVWFDKPEVDRLRVVKVQILEMAESRFLLLGEDPDCLPLQLAGSAGYTLNFRDSWERWEAHLPAYESIYSAFDLWSPLPVAVSNGVQVLENAASVPARPSTALF